MFFTCKHSILNLMLLEKQSFVFVCSLKAVYTLLFINQCVLRGWCFLGFAGINESYQMGLFQVLAAILHLGNVEIKEKDSDSSLIPVRIMYSLHIRRDIYHL